MGLVSSISNLITKVFKKPKRVVMIGIESAGKTTLLYRLKLGKVVETIPTIGFNIETVQCKNLSFTVWDAGGAREIRKLWRHYYLGSDAGIFVFDSQDRNEERKKFAAAELHRFSLEIDQYGIPLLIFANKQDCEGAMSLEEIKQALHPQDLLQKIWHIQPCSAKTGEGLYEGFEWIGRMVGTKS